MDNKSISHSRWNCTYHIVFIPKYRRKIMYGEVKRDLIQIYAKPMPIEEYERKYADASGQNAVDM